MKTIRILYLLTIVALVSGACQKWDYYKEFVPEGEKFYPSIDAAFRSMSGNERLQLNWQHTNDPRVTRYAVFWNSGLDSMIYSDLPNPGDSIYLVMALPEAVYDFTIHSYDAKGNKSVPRRIGGARVYGQNYTGSLYNRGLDADNPYLFDEDGALTLNFSDATETEVVTEINYTNRADEIKVLPLRKGETSVTLVDYKADTDIQYRSSYKPTPDAIDTFYVAGYSLLEIVHPGILVDKSLFKEVLLPTDMDMTANGTSMHWLWDGRPGAHPEQVHAASGASPQHFTFDLGGTYELMRFEQWGRMGSPGGAAHNPQEMEIWGIADLTDAITTLPSTDPGWADESIAKGWVLLGTMKRADGGDGVDMEETILDANAPAVRYIRLRTTKTMGNSSLVNFSEISFYRKP